MYITNYIKGNNIGNNGIKELSKNLLHVSELYLLNIKGYKRINIGIIELANNLKFLNHNMVIVISIFLNINRIWN